MVVDEAYYPFAGRGRRKGRAHLDPNQNMATHTGNAAIVAKLPTLTGVFICEAICESAERRRDSPTVVRGRNPMRFWRGQLEEREFSAVSTLEEEEGEGPEITRGCWLERKRKGSRISQSSSRSSRKLPQRSRKPFH